jgi:hypothetical protein
MTGLRRMLTSAVALVAFSLTLGGFAVPASGAITHQLEATFNGSGVPGGSFGFLTAVAADNSSGPSSGDLYVGSFSTIYKLIPDGTYAGVEITGADTPQGSLSLVPESGALTMGGVAVDESTGANSGDLYVSDIQHGVVDKFSEDGEFLCQISGRPKAEESIKECASASGSATPDGSMEPTGITVDAATGDVWVADLSHGAVDRFDASGKYVEQIKDAHTVSPTAIALGPTGNLYVTTPQAVSVFHEGAFTGALDEHEPTSVAVDPQTGHVYVHELEGLTFAEYDATGHLLDRFGEEKFYVTGMSVSTDGHFYSGELFFGTVSKFGPDLALPDVTTGPATLITETGATLTGHVDPDAADGGGPVTACEFEYVTLASFEANGFQGASHAPCQPPTPFSGPEDVSAAIGSLSPSTTYKVRLSASNAIGIEVFGAALELSTSGPPIITDEIASPSATTATLTAKVDASGFEADCRLQYVDQANYEASGFSDAVTVPCSPGDIPPGATEQVKVSVAALALAATYHYRFVSTNSAGTTDGEDQAFVTFGIKPNSFSFAVLDAEGHPDTRAGAHPYEWTTSFTVNTGYAFVEAGHTEAATANLRTVETELPPGLIAGATATPRCTRVLVSLDQCPAATQVGEIEVVNSHSEHIEEGLYNVVPPEGVPVEFGAVVLNTVRVYVDGNVRTDGDYGATAKVVGVSAQDNIISSRVSIWGVPQDPSHDARRVCPIPGVQVPIGGGCPATGPLIPLLTNPTSCPGTPLTATLRVDSWQAPNQFLTAKSEIPATTGCSALDFTPKISIAPDTSVADSPSGLNLNLEVPQNETPAGLATSALKDTTVALPTGVSVSPSAAGGLEACSEAQIGLHSDEAPQCPNGSKIGTVEVTSPLISDHLSGGVYLATQKANPFGSLLAMYIAAEADGARVKLAGRIDADPVTGQLTTTFTENPQLPFSDLKLNLLGGPHGALRTPSACGTYSTHSSLTPWARPGEPVTADSPFQISSCAHTGFTPSFSAGTENPLAGAFSPFTLRIAREDGNQEIGGLETTLPVGLLGSLKGIPYCPDPVLASISEAAGTGRAQEEHPSCPAASQVGTVTVGAGPGSAPFFTNSGKAYLAGPYKGAPFSLAVVTPAVAGPFDLGTVVVRNALRVDPQATQVTAVSDPFPRILHGIPLDLRDVRVRLDRPDFILNPTNCEPQTITSRITSTGGAAATPSEHFQVAGCERLAFKPKLAISLKGSTRHAGHPALKATLTYPKGGSYANIARAQVNLPHSEFIDQANLNKTCTRPVLLAGNCPATSVYGKARAWTPLLDKPLEGPVYLVGGYGYKLPALVAELDGQIRVLLVGKVDSGPNHGIRNTFEAVPDAPVEKFVLEMKGGPKYSLLENSEDLCASPQKARARFTAQDGRVLKLQPPISVDCGKKADAKKSRGTAKPDRAGKR